MSKYENFRKQFLLMWPLGPIFSKKQRSYHEHLPVSFSLQDAIRPPKKYSLWTMIVYSTKEHYSFLPFNELKSTHPLTIWVALFWFQSNLVQIFAHKSPTKPFDQVVHCLILPNMFFTPQASSIFNWVHVKVSPKAYEQTTRLRVAIAQSHCQI